VGVGSRPHDGPRPPPVRSSTAVSIQMTDDLLEELSKDVSPLASLVFHSARKLPRPRRIRRRWQAGGSTTMRDMTHLEEPQSAAGIPALVPGGWTDQPWLAEMDARLRQITFGSINLSFFNCARSLSVPLWALA